MCAYHFMTTESYQLKSLDSGGNSLFMKLIKAIDMHTIAALQKAFWFHATEYSECSSY